MTLWQGQGSNESGTAVDDVCFLACSVVHVQNQLRLWTRLLFVRIRVEITKIPGAIFQSVHQL